MADQDELYWLSVVARALASFSLQTPELRNQSMTERAQFLLGIGLSYQDAAEMLGSTEASLRELLRVAKKSKGRKGNARKSSR